MAEAVAEAIAGNAVLVAEAGTGTGKTYAYLVPALLSGGKVIVSTGTKNLQDQLYDRDIPTVRRDKGEPTPGKLSKTKAGYLDLSTLPRKPYTHADLTAEMQQFFRGQGIDEVEIYEGTQADRPLLEITTNSEGSVFKALNTTANALLHMREAFPGKIAAFEVLLTTPERERAGQFVLTPEMATDLISRKVDVTAFFVKNVQF